MAPGGRECPGRAQRGSSMSESGSERVKRLEKQVADLSASLPAHSVSPLIIEKLDRLEDELEKARKELAKEQRG